ncbi:MAG TPA: hypothetical protein VL125_17095 [Pelobium sp.]|nr:hypothetical protein [Pelobium sp.]
MKNYILIMGCLFITCCGMQNRGINLKYNTNMKEDGYQPLSDFKNDTISYIKDNFIKHKSNYIGKEIKNLLNDLELPIKIYYLGIDPNVEQYYYITFQFYNDSEVDDKVRNKVDPLILNIFLENPVKTTIPLSIYKKANKNWTKDASEFWETQKIKDIEMVNHKF